MGRRHGAREDVSRRSRRDHHQEKEEEEAEDMEAVVEFSKLL